MFTEIINAIKKYHTVIIHRHHHPDGDALGSQIGMKHIIRENFPEKQVFCVGDDAGFYGFMDDSVMDEIPDSAYAGALAIILDTATPHLISDSRYTLAEYTVRLDHHIFCEKIADAEVVDTSFESCCGLVTRFAMDCGLRVNSAAATALYTGMVTDSGRFRYDSTTAQTFRMASFLMEQGINTNRIFRSLYADNFESKKLKAQFILKTQFTANNVAYIYTTLEEFKTYCTQNEMSLRKEYDSLVAQYGESIVSSYYGSWIDLLNHYCPNAASLAPSAEVWELYKQNGGSLHLDGAWRRAGGHTVFGQVYHGMNVVDAIAAVRVDTSSKPIEEVKLLSITVTTYGSDKAPIVSEN